MFIYTYSPKLSTRPDRPHPSSKRRAAFARQATIRAFGPKAIRAQAESDEEREAALAVASEIANLIGLDTDLIGQEVG